MYLFERGTLLNFVAKRAFPLSEQVFRNTTSKEKHDRFNQPAVPSIRLCLAHFSLSCIGEENGNPLQCSCLENPRDSGAWWAAVYGVAQSWTRLSDSAAAAATLRSLSSTPMTQTGKLRLREV